MAGCEDEVRRVLRDPDEVRRSRSDRDVYLFYRTRSGERWVCAVAKRLREEGFLITTYPKEAIKANGYGPGEDLLRS